MISRERATDIASEAVSREANEHDPATVYQVVSGAEIPPSTINIYDLKGVISDYWIVYLRRPSHEGRLASSEVILVSKTDGVIAYWGSAGDEG